MRTVKRYWYLWAILALASCASLTPAKSFDQQLAYVQGGLTTAVISLTNAVSAGQVSSADAQKADELIQTCETAVKAARSAEGSGDMTTATQKLQAATTALTAVQKYLISKGVK